jgi:hypothetical protein
VAAAEDVRRSTPKPVSPAGGETTLKVCGVGVVMLPGQELSASLVDRLHGERGNHLRSPFLGRPGAGWGRSVADCGPWCGAEAS